MKAYSRLRLYHTYRRSVCGVRACIVRPSWVRARTSGLVDSSEDARSLCSIMGQKSSLRLVGTQKSRSLKNQRHTTRIKPSASGFMAKHHFKLYQTPKTFFEIIKTEYILYVYIYIKQWSVTCCYRYILKNISVDLTLCGVRIILTALVLI